MTIIGVIPARYASTRFPGKPLALIAGKTLIERVVAQCQKARTLSEVVVATDDDRIAVVARKFARVEMTSSVHPSGTDRIAEVAGRVPGDAYVNIQGDEPLIDPTVIDAVAGLLGDFPMSTASTPIRSLHEYDNPNVVKVVTALDRSAIYFSRRTLPYLRDRVNDANDVQLASFPFQKHLGIYGYRRETLLRMVEWPVSSLEAAERLEQLRALEHGIAIGVVEVAHDSLGVDLPTDIARAEAALLGNLPNAS